jgi:hypothetical protein
MGKGGAFLPQETKKEEAKKIPNTSRRRSIFFIKT